jgi:hypothetical protein
MSAATAAPTNIPWQSHKWSEPDGRRVEIERGKPLKELEDHRHSFPFSVR